MAVFIIGDFNVVDYSIVSENLSINTECFILDSTPSTNDFLSALPISDKSQICVAREQTNGKGQYDRQWLSKKDSSVLTSLRINYGIDTSLNGLSLVVGIAIIDVLIDDYGVDKLKLKWPNDVYFDNKKLAGILIENRVQNKSQSVIIGIGLNNNLDDSFSCETPWTDLSRILEFTPKIETLTVNIINKVIKYSNQFEQDGLGAFKSKWAEFDYLLNKKLELNYNGSKMIGTAKGINHQGALIIETKGVLIEAFSSEQIKLI
tara:strand:+ start:79 stop:864 length:786 start_codon:yes stop_codon:yes gene_type:complete